MKAIETKAQVDDARMLTITMEVPSDVPVGEYEVMVVLNSLVASGPSLSDQKTDEEKSRSKRWQKWFEEVDQLPLKADGEDKTFHQILVEKYRKQGLDL